MSMTMTKTRTPKIVKPETTGSLVWMTNDAKAAVERAMETLVAKLGFRPTLSQAVMHLIASQKKV